MSGGGDGSGSGFPTFFVGEFLCAWYVPALLQPHGALGDQDLGLLVS